MHIIAGKYKGMSLAYDKPWVRPTTSMARAGFFSSIGDDIVGARFLDLCTGTGAMAIEALSRGAAASVGIDARLELAKQNSTKLKVEGLTLYKNDVLRALEILERKGETFNIIFFDPPYAYEGIEDVVDNVSQSSVLLSGGVFAVEHDNKTHLPERLNQLIFYRRYDYGQSKITVYRV